MYLIKDKRNLKKKKREKWDYLSKPPSRGTEICLFSKYKMKAVKFIFTSEHFI